MQRFPGLAPKHFLSSLDWGFIFKKKAKHIFNSHDQMERALLRQCKGNKTEQDGVAWGFLPALTNLGEYLGCVGGK